MQKYRECCSELEDSERGKQQNERCEWDHFEDKAAEIEGRPVKPRRQTS